MDRQFAYGQPQPVTAAAEAADGGDWITLWPAGGAEVVPVDGRGSWRVTDAAKVVETSLATAAGHVLPIDFDHDIHKPRPGRTGRAVGWIDRLEAAEDGAIRGRVEWTAEGREALASRAYRFISPAFGTDKAGNVTRIVGAGLVNVPAIQELPAVAHAQEDDPTMTKEQLAALRKAFGLTDDADAAAIVTAADQLSTSHTALETAAAKVANAAGQDELTEAVATGVAAKLQTASAEPDPKKYVPKPAYDELAARVEKLETASAASGAQAAVEAATKAGKVSPALNEWAMNYATADPEGFAAWAEKAPVIVAAGRDPAIATAAAHTDKSGLSAEELQVARSMGLTAEAFKAARDENEETSQ
ncbi:phage protease [Minwuia thermotolerans]|uniref:Mu-like prophage I protein n=1 Tax=Minwuia thermotolerans TaxID=2056226 RepID=A0A2M9G0V6_9PROT|nr:phage protease [Minwuia thermotolerans]PJK29329.1 hypothetical protein CVT23_12045 [Minwuia thermotolerans]PJK30486.1 hypothetical protein CVT23_05950 [Minwuia thermotolerans]PJK30709.1 hypothetical protein CVT23_04900 [Minwuia thermotolerans]